MSTVINTNIKSLMAANALNINGRAMTHTMQSLSTGSRINQASDDAAGLSIRENITAQIRGLNAAVRNASDLDAANSRRRDGRAICDVAAHARVGCVGTE
jgi:flagellin-like hook-associated protein FlgL